MAQRFRGPNSPGATPAGGPAGGPYVGKRPARLGARVNFLFLAPLPLAIMAFFRDPGGLALSLAAFGLLILAAWLTREGVRAEESYYARKIARRPGLPRKMLGSFVTGAGLFTAGMINGSLFTALLFGVLGAVLHFLAFGPDPMKNRGMEGLDEYQTDRVARAVERAETHLRAMQDAIRQSGDRALVERVEGFAATARDMFRTVEDDPRDLTAARKFLGVYLKGARDATVKFASLHGRSRDPAARQKARDEYLALLDDLEGSFAARTQAFLLDDRTDLEVEIEVLRERLAREGVAVERILNANE